jgi:hypothetical protein
MTTKLAVFFVACPLAMTARLYGRGESPATVGCMPGAETAEDKQKAVGSDLPGHVEHDFEVKDFRFRSGETLPTLRMHYVTLGRPSRDGGQVTNAIVLLHGTTGSGKQFLQASFARAMFGSGQPLDATKYYLIIPDGIGHGGSSRPSDRLRAKFPRYGYRDMVEAYRALVVEELGGKANASRPRHVDGWDAYVDIGQPLPGRHGRPDASRMPTSPDRWAEPVLAPGYHSRNQERPGI